MKVMLHPLINQLPKTNTELGFSVGTMPLSSTDSRVCYGFHIYLIRLHIHLGVVV